MSLQKQTSSIRVIALELDSVVDLYCRCLNVIESDEKQAVVKDIEPGIFAMVCFALNMHDVDMTPYYQIINDLDPTVVKQFTETAESILHHELSFVLQYISDPIDDSSIHVTVTQMGPTSVLVKAMVTEPVLHTLAVT